jgi:hypothetical protein
MSMSQRDKIINYLVHHPEGITSMESFSALRITKLATRISELKDMGYQFRQAYESHKNAEGETVRYMRYWLIGGAE